MALWLLLAICCVSFWEVWCAFYFIGGAPWEKSRVNISMALLTGILGSAGAISFFLALQHGLHHSLFLFQRCIPSLRLSSVYSFLMNDHLFFRV